MYRKKALIFILIIAINCFLFPITAFTEVNQKTIKVGYFDYYGFISKENNGEYKGYGVEYLNEISKYTNWNYEYVYGTWSECLDRLSKGEIDLLCTAQHSEERANLYDYATYPSGLEYATMYVSNENNYIYYNDFESFNGLKVGLLKDSYQNELFDDYAEKHNFSVTKIFFDKSEDMSEALRNGTIDALLDGSLRKETTEKIVAKFSLNPFYFITTKGNKEVLDNLNNALENIKNVEPYYDEKLYNKYYMDSVANKASFTREEEEFIKNNPKLIVTYRTDRSPIEFYDDQKKEFSGINSDMLKLISEKAKIKFQYKLTSNYYESIDLVNNEIADMLTSEEGINSSTEENSIKYTEEYLTIPMMMIGKKEHIQKNENFIIALPKIDIVSKSYFELHYPKSKIIYCNDVDECLKEIKKGHADITVANIYKVNEIINKNNYRNLTMVDIGDLKYSISIGINKDMDSVLISILNKAILSITEEEKTAILIKNSSYAYKNMTIKQIFYQYNHIVFTTVIVVGIIVFNIVFYIKTKKQKELEEIAYIDEVTGIWNYKKFIIEAERLLKEKSVDEKYILVCMDIHNFKYINDSYGRVLGDSVLKHIANSLKNILPEKSIYARLSGDNFVYITKYTDKKSVISFIYSNEKVYSQFCLNNNDKIQLTFSFGLYEIQNGEYDVNDMLDKVMIVLQGMKNSHYSKYAFYNKIISDKLDRENEIEASMENALLNNEFKVYLQPKYNLNTRDIVGAEALIRWISPEKGFLRPDEFIPLFEKNGFIVNLDFFVLEEICKLIRKWLDQGIEPVVISVNQSRAHFNNEFYIENLCEVVNKYNIPPSLIELELTESVFLDNTDIIVSVLSKMKGKGFLISIDDFGSGYSSLNLLKKVFVDVLKIDKEFLDETTDSERSRSIIKKVVEMAKELKMKVICEGVETEEQATFLRGISCDMAQGYLYAKPMPIAEFDDIIKNKK